MLLLVLLHRLSCCCWLAPLTWLRLPPEVWWEEVSSILILILIHHPQTFTLGIQSHTEWCIIVILLMTLSMRREVTLECLSCFYFSCWLCFCLDSIKTRTVIQLLCSSFRLVTCVDLILLQLLPMTNNEFYWECRNVWWNLDLG